MKVVLKLLLMCFTASFSVNSTMGQENPSYEMTLIKVIVEEQNNEVAIILKVLPTIEDFKLIISGRAEFTFGRESFKTNIQTDPNIQLVVYGDDFYVKAPELYDLINEDLDLSEHEFLLVFNFSNIKVKKLTEGSFKYGLWESTNSEIRNEKMFYFGKNDIIRN